MALNRIAEASLEDTTIALIADHAAALGISYDAALDELVLAGKAHFDAEVAGYAVATGQSSDAALGELVAGLEASTASTVPVTETVL